MDAREYFMKRRSANMHMGATYARIAYVFQFRNGLTMEQLCAMPPHEIMRIRGIGEQALAIILRECQHYLQTGGATEP